MNRRNFLKSIGKVVAGCAIVPSASEAKPQLTVAKLMEAKKALDATIDETDEFDLFTGYRTKKPSVHCEICDGDCPHFLQCHRYDSDALTEVVEEKLATYYWIDMGYWSSGVKQLACCYTRSDGMRMRLAVLSEDDKIEETKKVTEKRKKAIEGGAWYPTSITEYYLA